MKKNKKVVLASPRGFCAGVVRAIDIVNLALDVYGQPIFVRREIVHNKFVVNELHQLQSSTDARLFAASQYISWVLNENGLAAVNSFSAGLLCELEARLGSTLGSDRAELLARNQDPDRWLVLDRRPEVWEVQ